MLVKLCGRAVRDQKPIKVYSYFKTLLALLLTMAVFQFSAAFAAEEKIAPPAASVKQERILQNTSYDRPAQKPQRQARTYAPSAQAMALVLALGLRNVPGPVENRAAAQHQD